MACVLFHRYCSEPHRLPFSKDVANSICSAHARYEERKKKEREVKKKKREEEERVEGEAEEKEVDENLLKKNQA